MALRRNDRAESLVFADSSCAVNDVSREPDLRAFGAQDEGDPEWLVLADALPMVASYLEWDGAALRYRFANKNYEKWFRVKREDLVGRPLHELDLRIG